MSQKRKLEQVLEHLLSENSEAAEELLHQIIVEKARTIYESIVDEEDEEAEPEEDNLNEAEDDVVGGEPNRDFTDEISSDIEDVESEEENDGEADDDFSDEGEDEEEGEDEGEEELEDRVDDLEDQLEELRAEFEQLMGGEEGEMDMEVDADGDEMEAEFDLDTEKAMEGGWMEEESEVPMYEKKAAKKKAVEEKPKMEKAKQPSKEPKKGKKAVEEETQFLNKVADTGQRGTAKLVGAGTHSKLGAENNQSTFTNAPSKKDYGGKPLEIGKGTGGEYGKYHGDSAKDDTPSDNLHVEPKKAAHAADSTAKYTGGKAAGDGGSKSPLTKKPA